MQVIILKYVQVLCITVFFSNNINCDKLLLHNEQEDQHLYRIGSCAAQCLAEQNTTKVQSLESCHKLCSEGAAEKGLSLVQGSELNFNIRLICRGSNSLVIEVQQSPVESVEGNSSVTQRAPKKFDKGLINQLVDNPSPSESKDIGRKNVSLDRNRRSIADNKNKAHNNATGISEKESVVQSELDQENRSNASSREIPATRYIFLIKVQESGQELGDRIVYMSNASIVKIENLAPNKQYNVTATVLSSNHEYFYADKRQQFKTLPLDYTPGNITTVDVVSFSTNRRNNSLLDAIVTWVPAIDRTCHYEILCHASHSPEFHLQYIDVQKPEELYRHKVPSLELGSEYSLGIRAKNGQNYEKESALYWHTFHTPSCNEWHNGSEICGPETIKNFRVRLEYISENNYWLNASWDKPHFNPEYYKILLFDYNPMVEEDDGHYFTQNTTGNSTNMVIESITIVGPHCEVFMQAYANKQTSESGVVYINRLPTRKQNENDTRKEL